MSQSPPGLEANAERLDQLRRVAFFRGLNDEGLTLIAEVASEETHPKGARLFNYGDVGDKLFIIVSGKIRISRDIGGMGEEALAVLGPGEVFGEMALVNHAPRSADAHVHEACRVLAIAKEAFEELLFRNKDLAYEVLWNCVRLLATRLRETNDKLTFLTITGKF